MKRKASGWGNKTAAQRDYGKGWKKTRRRVIQRDRGWCQHCLKAGRYTKGNQCDHIKPRAEGGGDEMSNLQLLCIPCHNIKSLRDRGYLVKGTDATGLPTQPDHPWNQDQEGEAP